VHGIPQNSSVGAKFCGSEFQVKSLTLILAAIPESSVGSTFEDADLGLVESLYGCEVQSGASVDAFWGGKRFLHGDLVEMMSTTQPCSSIG
jgi:hypothetical protein